MLRAPTGSRAMNNRPPSRRTRTMAPLLLDLVSHDQAEDPTDARAQSPHEPQRQPAHRAQEVGEIDAVGKAELAASQGRAGRAGVRTRSRRNCSVHPAVLTPCSRRPPRRPADATEEILREPRGHAWPRRRGCVRRLPPPLRMLSGSRSLVPPAPSTRQRIVRVVATQLPHTRVLRSSAVPALARIRRATGHCRHPPGNERSPSSATPNNHGNPSTRARCQQLPSACLQLQALDGMANGAAGR